MYELFDYIISYYITYNELEYLLILLKLTNNLCAWINSMIMQNHNCKLCTKKLERERGGREGKWGLEDSKTM